MPRSKKELSELSHSGRYYRQRTAAELARKRRERARYGSTALALVRRVQDRTLALDPEERRLVESFAPREVVRRMPAREGMSAHDERYYSLTARQSKTFSAFMRAHGWAVPSKHRTGRHVSFELTKKRMNFLAEALGETEMLETRQYREVYGGA